MSAQASAEYYHHESEPKPGLFNAIKEVYNEFSEDDVMTQAAALAFYSGLAFAPLLTICVWAASILFGPEAKEKTAAAFEQVLGPTAGQPIRQLLDPATSQAADGMTFAGIFSIVLLALSASGVFGQLQGALNAIWHVQQKPSAGWRGLIRKRVLSLGMLMSILFLLMTSLVLSTILQGVLGTQEDGSTLVWAIVNNVISVGVFTLLFAALFKYVPDAKISWRAVWVGALLSAILFTAGKFALALYLGRGSYESSYGAAIGSFVALLVWVYYSATILLAGAEATEVYARRKGHAVEPSQHAVRVFKETEDSPRGKSLRAQGAR